MAADGGGKAQVKIELWTKQSNIQLPEETGPILVDTRESYKDHVYHLH